MSSSAEAKWTFAQKFYVDFNTTASELTSRLDALKNSVDVPPAAIQAIALDLSRLARSLSDATGSMPSYDQRQCELQIKALEKSLEELRGPSASAPRFSFKRKATKPMPSSEHAIVVSPPIELQPAVIEAARTLSAFSHRYMTILDVRFPDSSTEVSISDLDNCIVNLLPGDEDQTKITALHVQRVSQSVLLLPQISGSIILHDLSECVIAVGCHQFRMHNSTMVDVYLESGSDSIIENCFNIRFAAYPRGLVRGGTLQDSKHFTIRDFSHILHTTSPNWNLLPEEKREKSWPLSVLRDQALRGEIERMLSARSLSSDGGL